MFWKNAYFSYREIVRSVPAFQFRAANSNCLAWERHLGMFPNERCYLNIKGYFSVFGIICFSFNKFSCFRAITSVTRGKVSDVYQDSCSAFYLVWHPWLTVIWDLWEKGSWVTEWQIETFDNLVAVLVPLGSEVSRIVVIQFKVQGSASADARQW